MKVTSANTFPEASGIASSASSFAALTLGVALSCASDQEVFKSAWKDPEKGSQLRLDLAEISRQGSGSSCRSLVEGPWVVWKADAAPRAGGAVTQVKSQLPELTDLVVLVSSDSKEVSSSLAHSWVKTSPLWQGRMERAEERVKRLEVALLSGNIPQVSRIAWQEMWEMHSLFHTCERPFTYWQPDTLRVLKWLSKKLDSDSPPIVTLDAGPNIHVLVPSREAAEWRLVLRQNFPELQILQDTQGWGAQWWSGVHVR
jgi:diphosphomevalonate decarboxylase